MRPSRSVHRVIVLVLDGLRPDAIDALQLHHLQRLRDRAAATLAAVTVAPAVTWAAMTSLLTGVPPRVHGIVSEHLRLLWPRAAVTPLPRLLAEHGLPATAFMAEIPFVYRGLARRIAHRLGFTEARFAGRNAPDILFAARETLQQQREGLILLHWPDADRAGHEHGWMSREYAIAARRLDATAGLLNALTEAERDPNTLLVICADHGGGGVDPRNHESAHPLDRTIPILAVGGRVVPGALRDGVSLLDIPPTILWSLGVAIPDSYSGRILDSTLAGDSSTSAVA